MAEVKRGAPSGKWYFSVELQYAIWSVFLLLSIAIDIVTEMDAHIRFECDLFRRGMGRCCVFVGPGTARGLSRQTSKAVEEETRDSIIENLDNWNARTMNAHLSISIRGARLVSVYEIYS